jgi:hypothetical protein
VNLTPPIKENCIAMKDPLARLATIYSQYKASPPRVVVLLLKPRGLPALALTGVLGTAALVALQLHITLPAFWAGFCFGAACCYLRTAIKAVKYWPVQSQLLNWQKIEEITATEIAHAKAKPA